jgi:hypothetical protein
VIYKDDLVYAKGRYKVVTHDYNCHPETCSHWDHPRYCVQYQECNPSRWVWYRDMDDLKEAKSLVDSLTKEVV